MATSIETYSARLQTSYASWHGELTDISAAGGCFKTNKPPREGAVALVAWGSFETLCEIVWCSGDQCGIRFEKLLPELARSRPAFFHGKAGPAAALRNIPFGQKRSAGAFPRRPVA